MADVQVALPIPIPPSQVVVVPAALEPEPVATGAVVTPSSESNAPIAPTSPTLESVAPLATSSNTTIAQPTPTIMGANGTAAQVETPITESVEVPGDAVSPEETGSAQVEGGAGGEETGASQLAEGLLPTASDDSNATNDDDTGNDSNGQNQEGDVPPRVPLVVPVIPPIPNSVPNDDGDEEQPSNEEPLLPRPESEDAPLPELDELFPFHEEEDIDLGPTFEGQFVVYGPVYDTPLPFNELEDTELPEVVKGNFASFFQLKCGHEFYRNYVRGNTMRRLRTAKDSVKGKPNALQGVMQLPVELLFDILELAHPMDLMHLSRTSKGLRKVVLSKSSEPVWKAAYNNYDELNNPPEDIPYPKWTAMMYDDARCDFCGDLGALLDFALGEHYCERCQCKYLIEQTQLSDITEEFPNLLPTLFQLLPATYRQSGGKYQCYYESDSNARYRRKDVEKMVEELKTWFMTIDEGMIPDAGQKFKEWCEPQMRKARSLSDSAQMYNNWATNFYYNLCTELSMKQRALADSCMKRFAKMGYDEQDTNSAASDVYYYFRSVEVWEISPKSLEKHKSEIISKIEAQKLDRMKRERRVIVDKTYDDYKKTLKPEQWAGLPPSDIVACEDVFCDYIAQDTLTDVKELDIPKAMAAFPETINNWHFQRQKELYDLLPGVEIEDEYVYLEEKECEGLSVEEINKRTTELRKAKKASMKAKMDERMKLARTMFSCISCKSGRHAGLAVFGWEEACVHMAGSYSHYFHSNWEFCSVGYAAASSLISQLGLDPDTATLEEVDAKDARFLCMNCPTKSHKRVQGRKAYTWRECVAHAVEKQEDFTHAIPTCLLLSEDATAFIKSHELPHPAPRRVNWSCNHCPEHLETPATFKDVEKHVKESHSIEKPVKGVDVVFLHGRYERNHNGKRRPIFHYGVEPTCHLICQLCRQGRVRRLWTIQALVPHLYHSHGITMPRSTRDYTKIEVYAT